MRPTKSSHSFEVKSQQVKFTSNFDSGNLRTVTQIGIYEFLIESAYDTYETPTSNKSFFHFKIENYPLGQPIILVVRNLALLECIKPVIYGAYCVGKTNILQTVLQLQWAIVQKNRVIGWESQDGLNLEIKMFITKPNIYLAFALPYSYERYLNMVRDLPDSNTEFYLKKQVLCYSKNLLLVYMITITSFDRRGNLCDPIGSSTNGVILPEKHLDQSRIYFDKPVILLSARVHPGETPSSWAIEGIIKFLISNCEQAKILRKHFQIIIVPMLNPDGVYEGMYRLDTQGHNLNRYYLISDNRQPSIYSMKHLIKHYNTTKRLLFYFDFHGHPSYKGSFLYGNAIDDLAYQAETELFGRIMSLHCDTFEQKYCIFDREQMSSKDRYDMYTKQGCARVYAFKTANILHSYTVEMGFHGCTHFPQSNNKDTQTFRYKEEDYYAEGVAVIRSVIEACGLGKATMGIDKKMLRKEIALEIASREERFRKQDKNMGMKKKNVNEILQNQYWTPIRTRFFNPTPEQPLIPKHRKIATKKIISRTSFISSHITSTTKAYEQIQQPETIESLPCGPFKQKLNTQSCFDTAITCENQTLSKNYLEHKKKKLQMRNMIFSNKKVAASSFSRKQDNNNSISIKKEAQRKISVQKVYQKIKRSQIKILSGRSKPQPSSHPHSLKPHSQNFQQLMFNDLNIRKGKSQTFSYNTGNNNGNSTGKNDFCIVSADKITSRVEELKDIFRGDRAGKASLSKYKVGKKYSGFFG